MSRPHDPARPSGSHSLTGQETHQLTASARSAIRAGNIAEPEPSLGEPGKTGAGKPSRRWEQSSQIGAAPGRRQSQSGPARVRDEAGASSKGWSPGLDTHAEQEGLSPRTLGSPHTEGFAASFRAQGPSPGPTAAWHWPPGGPPCQLPPPRQGHRRNFSSYYSASCV